MPRAVLRGGIIHLLDPLPSDWKEGQGLWVDATPESDDGPEEIDKWFRELNELCAQGDPEEDKRLQEFLTEIRREARGMARRGAGLP